MHFGGQKSDEITCDGVPPMHQLVQRGMCDITSGIFSIEVEGKRSCDYEPLSEAVHRSRVTAGVIADRSNPFSYDPQTISSIGYLGNVKVCRRSEYLNGWVKR
jgi:hypothetical protein